MALINEKLVTRDPDKFLQLLENESIIDDIYSHSSKQQQKNQEQRNRNMGKLHQHNQGNTYGKGNHFSPVSKDEALLVNQNTNSSNNLKIYSVDKVINFADESEVNFENLAREYKFQMMVNQDKLAEIEELCLHNAKVAQTYKIDDAVVTWT